MGMAIPSCHRCRRPLETRATGHELWCPTCGDVCEHCGYTGGINQHSLEHCNGRLKARVAVLEACDNPTCQSDPYHPVRTRPCGECGYCLLVWKAKHAPVIEAVQAQCAAQERCMRTIDRVDCTSADTELYEEARARWIEACETTDKAAQAAGLTEAK